MPLKLEIAFCVHGVIALNCDSLVLAAPPPVTMRSCSAPMSFTPRKHHKPSVTTLADGASDLAAKAATSSVVNGC